MRENEAARVTHQFAPIFDAQSRILILGTFPSVKSRENQFYYGHPQNRFWKVLARMTGETVPETIEEKTNLLLHHGIAVWDVIASCRINGSSDSSIRDVVPAELTVILEHSPVERIYANGSTAKRLYEKFSQKKTGRPIIGLPSTSPANAAYSMERLMEYWGNILD